MKKAAALRKFVTEYHIAKVLNIHQSAVGRWGETVPQKHWEKLAAAQGGKLVRGGYRVGKKSRRTVSK